MNDISTLDWKTLLKLEGYTDRTIQLVIKTIKENFNITLKYIEAYVLWETYSTDPHAGCTITECINDFKDYFKHVLENYRRLENE